MHADEPGTKPLEDDPHRQREGAKYDNPIASREHITAQLKSLSGPVDFEALAELLGIDEENSLEALRRRVAAMIRDGQLVRNRRRGLIPVDKTNLMPGRVSAHPDGYGFVIVEESSQDIYLNARQMRQVLHGDRVIVTITGEDARGRREGRIVNVVERANQTLVGRVSVDRGTVVVLPDNKRIHQDLLIPPGELSSAVDGDMVVAQIIEQPGRKHQPVGKVIEVLGQHLEPGMEIDVALRSHGIPFQWPEAVSQEANGFAPTVDEATLQIDREDIRDLPLITIDGEDARDFDDAVWCESLDSGGWRLIVAIADVAHYVTPGSALDREAIERGTSVYFPGRVVPMLPESLSNGLCSLNPDVDRLCMICDMRLDADGIVKRTQFRNGLMRSHARLTYDQVYNMLSQSSSPLKEQYKTVYPMIESLHSLYKVIAHLRRERGAIDFESNETQFVFDEDRKIREIVPVVRHDAHKMIEECMILANIQAADLLLEHQIPSLYRVHSGPKADRLEDLRAFIALRGLTLTGSDTPSPRDFAHLAQSIKDLPERNIIQSVMLRSMQQAVYQPANDGHFGLALKNYVHFTSPIRRYPDLLVHRGIKHAISKGRKADYAYTLSEVRALGESCSMTERRAEDASRDVSAWLKCEFMLEHVGAEFTGVISAVTSFGVFVELDDTQIEGLLHVTNLHRDYYRFDQAAHALIGERSGRHYHLGDKMVVQVAAVNLEERKIDFAEILHSSSKKKVSSKPHADSGRGEKKRNTASSKEINPEHRRQQKRKRKQQRRDDKRAAAKAVAQRKTTVRKSRNAKKKR